MKSSRPAAAAGPASVVILVGVALLCLIATAPAQRAESNASRSELPALATSIGAELEKHGERVMGQETLHWSTRLEQFSGCRATLSVKITNAYQDRPEIKEESSSFSLGAIDPLQIEVDKNWVALPCAGGEKCVYSISTCKATKPNGTTIDCTSASRAMSDRLKVYYDGDAASGERMKAAFRKAVEACQQSVPVTF